MEIDQLQDAIVDLRVMSPVERVLRYGLGILQWASVPAALFLAVYLGAEAASAASAAANADLARGGAEAVKGAVAQAAEWGLTGPEVLGQYLNRVGLEAGVITAGVVAVSEVAFFSAVAIVNRGLGHRVAP